MHATSWPETWRHWQDKLADAFQPHMADAEHPAPTRLADNPMRERLRGVRLVPLIVPGTGLLLACCAVLIGSLLR